MQKLCFYSLWYFLWVIIIKYNIPYRSTFYFIFLNYCIFYVYEAILSGYTHIYGPYINSSVCLSREEKCVSLSIRFNSVGSFWILRIINVIILCSLQFQLYAVFISMAYLLDCILSLVPCVCLLYVFYPMIFLTILLKFAAA